MSYLLGIDVSTWQGEMNWETAATAGAKFAFIRAGSINRTTGKCYIDYQFYRNISLAPTYMTVGCYWYFRPQWSPTLQANYFCDLIRDEDTELPPVLDLENTGGLTDQQITDAAAEFVGRVYEKLNEWPLMYGRAYWLNVNTNYHPIFSEMDLWIARYNPNLVHPWGDADRFPILKPEDWDEWTFWQFSADGNGRGAEFGAESNSIDLNYFNGDQAAFDQYIDKQPEYVLPQDIGVKINIDGVKYHGRIEKV